MNQGKQIYLIVVFCWLIFLVGSSMAVDLESIQGAWLFDEGKGNEVLDSSGKGHNGNIAGAVKWADGKFGSGLEFTGGKVTVPHADEFTTPTFTIMAWINAPNIPNDWGMMLVGKDGWPDRNYAMYITQGTGQLHFAFCAQGQQDVGNLNSKTVIADGKWRHVAMTYDMKMRRIFIDGNLDIEAPGTAKPSENMVNIEIGRGPLGTMDEVLIANQAFSEEDIKSAMSNGLEKFLGGKAVSKQGKLAITWGSIK